MVCLQQVTKLCQLLGVCGLCLLRLALVGLRCRRQSRFLSNRPAVRLNGSRSR